MSASRRVQLQLRIPYNFQPTRHRAVRERLAAGWRLEDYQRLSDQEILVTFVHDPEADPGEAPAAG